MAQALSVSLLCSSLFGGGALEASEEQWRVWLEARFMRPAANTPVAAAERTVLSGGFWRDGQLQAFSKVEWKEVGLEWAEFEKRARQQSVRDLDKMTLSYERDSRQVIRYAEMHCREPLVASAVLAASFGELFLDTLGDVVFVAVPNRYQAYVFPKSMGFPVQFTDLVLTGYTATAYPVSVELFECSKGRLRAVGVFQAP